MATAAADVQSRPHSIANIQYMHPNQLLKLNLEQVKVHIMCADKCNVDPNYPLYKYMHIYIKYTETT